MQSELASALYVTKATISNWERGERDLKSSTIIQLSEYFEVTADYLLGMSDYRTSQANSVSKVTGLTDDSINALKELAADGAKEDLEMINKVIMLYFSVRKEKNK